MLTHQSLTGLTGGNASAPTHVSVELFGSLRVHRLGAVLNAQQLGGPKPRQILEILLVHLGTAVSKDRLIELLWGGNPPAEARPTLESYVSVLRRHLQPGSGPSGPLQTKNGGYVMEPTLVDLDLDRFRVLLRRCQQCAPAEALPLLREALELAAAPLLGDELLPAWAAEERGLHAARVTDARILAAKSACALDLFDEAEDWANQALAGDPLNEHAWMALILALEQAGRNAEGLRAYERCRQVMDRELGCSPGKGLRDAQVRLLRATADFDEELSDVISALLLLNDQLRRTAGPSSVTVPPAGALVGREATKSLGDARDVVHSFLRRALMPTSLSA